MRHIYVLKYFLCAIICTYALHAQADTYRHWETGVTENRDLVYAATVNESGSVLGQYCTPREGQCVWLLGTASACKDGDRYSVLANSDQSAQQLDVYCGRQVDDGLYQYVFSDFSKIDSLVRNGLRIGLALPLQSDNFVVLRFDLGGATYAINSMKQHIATMQKKIAPASAPKGTKDQLM